MSLRDRLADAIGRNRDVNIVRQKSNYQIHVNALCSAYENLFAQVRPLINDMKSVVPYGVGRNGAKLPLKQTPEIAKLLDPNVSMGWGEFADAMFATWLTEDELNIRVHFDERRKRVTGYTILPVGSRQMHADGSYYWKITELGTCYEIGEDEVATLRFSRNPRNLDKGVSPASAIYVWSQIDDLVSQYQKAFFENGAVPATITFIKATSREKYEEKRNALERGLAGAKNRNKTVYIWRQLLDDGTQGDELEVKTIQGNNATLAIRDIIDIVNDKLNKAVGVSNFILGDDSSAKYDNAELSDYQFIKRRVYPALMSFWSQFQHELDRITGGLGYGIQFEIELPELTERLRTKAETARIRMESLKDLVDAGSMPAAAVTALGLGKKWLPAAEGVYSDKLRRDKLEELKATTYMFNINTNGEAVEEAKAIEAEPVETKDSVERKTDADDFGYEPVFGKDEYSAKVIYDMLVDYAQQIYAQNPDINPDELVDALYNELMKDAQDGVVQGVESVQALLYGKDIAEEIGTAFKEDYHISESFKEHLRLRTDKIVKNYGKEARTTLRNTLNQAANEGWSASKLKTELNKVVPRQRAELIARNETVYSTKAGRIEGDKTLERDFGIGIDLVWRISDNGACDVCKAMNGTKVKCGEAFPDHEMFEGVSQYWEHSSWNDYGATPDAHPNCRCYFDEEIRE